MKTKHAAFPLQLMEFHQHTRDKRIRIREIQRARVPSSMKAWLQDKTPEIGKGYQ